MPKASLESQTDHEVSGCAASTFAGKFLCSAGLIFAITGLAKIFSSFGSAKSTAATGSSLRSTVSSFDVRGWCGRDRSEYILYCGGPDPSRGFVGRVAVLPVFVLPSWSLVAWLARAMPLSRHFNGLHSSGTRDG